ncbi:MAG: di-heme oxidoredictase family protein [Paludisphaera borealis]|uniref:di-heme oxidoredictase family protein n=1 Tax=Paludisphaera borealis TaxID=1387353 RepID=UPI00284E43AA|nr:di-heme oxidoredictase family protein [Paludisphaera borealis]MDR3618040.1 di-heme oxidoredictase family protein [Paludisphaera borealis]
MKFWRPGEASPSGGDGVGPLFNEQSCVGCHNMGGTGGAGDRSKNVTILTAIPGASVLGNHRSIFQGELEDLHPSFRNRTSIVLHLHSTSETEEKRLAEIRDCAFVQTRDDLFALVQSRRNTPALFGAGRIDAIRDKELLAAEARKFPAFPEIKGRVSRLRDGRIGKFGWKGQTASLEDFVMAACANELGLEVRGRHQPSLLPAKDFDPKKISLDLSDDECALMSRFVANLSAPVVRPVGDASQGLAVFEAIGCATCHAPNMGSVHGLYSDLLLHDLGDRFRASGGYGGPSSEIVDNSSKTKDAPTPSGEAGPTEWRTTPLWGVADSAPYLHDGRASTLDEAVVLHGGEAEPSSKRYTSLSFVDRQAVLAFLHSQVAPPEPGRPADRTVRNARGKRR